MKVRVFPTNCGCCNGLIQFMPLAEAPGHFTFHCLTESCREYGVPYELPMLEVKQYVQPALLRPKFA